MHPSTPAPPPAPTVRGLSALRSKPALTLLCFWICLGALYALPTPLRTLLRGSPDVSGLAPTTPTVGGQAAREQPTQGEPVAAGAPKAADESPTTSRSAIEDPHGSLRHLARALSALKLKRRSPVRVLHYADSLIDLDQISGTARRVFQERYGNAGHGFTLLARPWRWYYQPGLRHGAATGFKVLKAAGRFPDGYLGLGGSALHTEKGGVARFGTVEPARFSSLELFYLRQPGGGTIELSIDGALRARLQTNEVRRGSASTTVKVPEGPHQVQIVATGRVRVFGAGLDRATSGVTWDNLPLVGTRLHELANFDATHWHEQLVQRKPDLVIFQFGANDSISFGGDLERYERGCREVLGRVRRARPEGSCLVVGPFDRLTRAPTGALYSPPVVRQVSARQRNAALASRCAFWDGQQAMGGPGSMKRWLAAGLVAKDLVHFAPPGSARLGRLLAMTLLRAVHAPAR